MIGPIVVLFGEGLNQFTSILADFWISVKCFRYGGDRYPQLLRHIFQGHSHSCTLNSKIFKKLFTRKRLNFTKTFENNSRKTFRYFHKSMLEIPILDLKKMLQNLYN